MHLKGSFRGAFERYVRRDEPEEQRWRRSKGKSVCLFGKRQANETRSKSKRQKNVSQAAIVRPTKIKKCLRKTRKRSQSP